jgi:phage terminase large subunit-like protein
MDTIFANDDIREGCLYGSGRSGKTFGIVDYVFNRAIAYPGSSQLFVRATLNSLTAGVVSQTFPNYFRVLNALHGLDLPNTKASNGRPFIEYKSTPHNRFNFYNGSDIRFVGLDVVSTNASAIDKILSQEYITIIFEEATEIDYEVVELAKSRLAQKVKHFQTGKEAIPKWFCSLNPRTFEDWDYVYFQEHKHPITDEPLSEEAIKRTATMHFHIDDNIHNVAATYMDTLRSMSTSGQQRFLTGMHGDNFAGEVFDKISWEALPDIQEFDRMLIYTDPSYKSGPKNDYKATVAVGRRQGAYWIIDGRANQCTTSHMILNVQETYTAIRDRGWEGPIQIYFENAGMPDDFVQAIQLHAQQSGWTCPYTLDNRVKGDKFARIESVLQPLNRDGKLFFNQEIRKNNFGRLCAVQFLNFKSKLLPTEHDDVPDAVHGAITLINVPVIRPGQVKIHSQRANNRLG